MKSKPLLAQLGLCVVLVGMAAGCRTNPFPEGKEPVGEQSVNPGINEEYLQDDLKVSEWVERFEREGRDVYNHRHEIVARMELEAGEDVADIGAGTGLFVPLLAEAVGPEGTVYAVDIAEPFLDHIVERAKEAGQKNVVPILAVGRSVRLGKESIDKAVMVDVYHHFEYPQSSLASIHYALRPGGELYLVEFTREPGKSSDWVLDHVRAGQEVFTKEIEAAGFERVEGYDFLEENYMLKFRKVSP